jgi:hypothetical protein
MLPNDKGIKPAIILKSEVFPEPFEPEINANCPAFNSKEILSIIL